MNSAERLSSSALTKELANTSWHAVSQEALFDQLETSREGLSGDAVDVRLQRFGVNRLPEAIRRGPFARLLLQFHNVLIYILIIAGVAKSLLYQWVDAGVIFGVVIINALIGFIQEGRAEKALDALRQMMSLEAVVKRDGRKQTVAADSLVPGDVVLIASGDKVPADLRLIDTRELQVDEAMLTGESVPVAKSSDPVEQAAALAERSCMAYSGTLVSSGRGVGVVIATGKHTELGKISGMVADTTAVTTPLIQKVNHFAHVLAMIIAVFALLTMGVGYLVGGHEPMDLFFAAIALAVAAIPEGLPAVMTIVLAIGVRRMAQRNAIIRRLPAVDTLGALTVICSDKTGTLTRNEMTVTTLILSHDEYHVTGVGYVPEGELQSIKADAADTDPPALTWLLYAASLCNEGQLVKKDVEWRPEGDPMEGALIVFAMKAGLPADEVRAQWDTVSTLPFESVNRFMASLHRVPGNASLPDNSIDRVLFVKGAPEVVIEMCQHQRDAVQQRPIDKSWWHRKEEQLAARGQRVLGIAYLPEPALDVQLEVHNVPHELTMLGLVGIIDPPREEAIRAVASCQEAGVRVVMITGDHALTAAAIGQELRIGDGERVITGQELDQHSADQLQHDASSCDVFARVSPEHKLRLVEAIQARGEVVAMTGDGVNDAPALKRADVGIAMGRKGTEVTKEAAEMVLADDNFASIARAVEEGRTVFDNLRKALLFILPTNGGEGLTIFVAIVAGMALPLTPVQVLWVNMITAVTLALALAFEPPEENVMRRPPRSPQAGLLNVYFLWRILLVSAVICIGTFAVFVMAKQRGYSETLARTLAVNCIVMFEACYLFNSRYITASVISLKGLFGSREVLLAVGLVVFFQMLYTYTPFFQRLFGSEAMRWDHWLVVVLTASTVFWIVEFEKWVTRKFFAGATRS